MSQVDEIWERLQKTTPGKWEWETDFVDGTNIIAVADGDAVLWGQDQDEYGAFIRVAPEDADFIVHAKSDIEYLLSEIDRLQSSSHRI